MPELGVVLVVVGACRQFEQSLVEVESAVGDARQVRQVRQAPGGAQGAQEMQALAGAASDVHHA
ncbi:hypothetical protein [Streptomyces sp. NL15-2K]|uniref:hypothetical protein n=1 Tax=Streptomyces sp. NL15-2K TaxID=376149 RepID=UPI00209BD078|nr:MULTISPECIES: hypothetical protein [Actinomycetes]WKX14236.1 hypothetical protein Q4V64_44660 [Kutzneria buriramensis]